MSQEVILEENKDEQWPETNSGHPKGLRFFRFGRTGVREKNSSGDLEWPSRGIIRRVYDA